MKQTLIIPIGLPGMNEMIRANRGTKAGYHTGANQKKTYTDFVARLAKQQLIPCQKQVDVSILWIVENKRKDKDNIMAGQKFIFDGLVEAGILPNDGWKEIGDITHTFTIGKEEQIQVTLQEVE